MSLAATMIVLSLLFITVTVSSSPPGGFTIDLIHRRSNSSSSRLSKTQLGSSPYADTIFDTSESSYYMKLQIGTPPVEIEALIDTGSELIWTQCMPCINCFDQQGPMFDPSKSSTYKEKICDGHSCPYDFIYGDGSYSIGNYATETVTIQSTSGQPFVMPETTFGCGNNNSGFSSTGSGIVGLSWASTSLISQLGEDYIGLFSYCFSGKGTSKINFGSNAIVAGDGVVATTMFIKKEQPGFYYLNLDAVSVGETRIETLGTPFHALDGNIVIDSGTTFTYLPDSYCNKVKEEVANVVKAEQVTNSDDMLCYTSKTVDIFPVITMHFSNDADLVLEKYNMFVDVGGDVFCLAIMCSSMTQDDGIAIFGNRAQNNFLVGYDSSSSVVSFMPTDCSALWS
ncbi:hypothetical protein EUTSA_v10002859mg [Eutrema salsugineum]|uniref:Peptidase A1 domain-containing protein n=1 Tax=Eutrema salsugineum TaxID=72664 RepID=V4MY51_EUTSA|nr:aspartic proteinase CDR1 [Eutrema salsugineum]ESQ37451.1 hypothetical protein EUTSA_v10002859mg [Eutrema salsugineum]